MKIRLTRAASPAERAGTPVPAPQAMLSIRDVVKYFDGKSGHMALDHVSFDVAEGEFLSILGPSGCGKTTLLRILIGLLPPTSGQILLDGQDITDLPPARRSMGIVFQNYALFENMTVSENVTYAARIKAKKEKKRRKKGGESADDSSTPLSREEIDRRAVDLLERLGIADLADRHPTELSGGQQQRVAIARTLMHNPRIMLFDEPMSALDMATRLQLRDVIKGIQAEFGTGMIYITHDQEEAFAMSDHILVMENAKVAQYGTPAEIVQHPAGPYVREFVVDNLHKKINSLSQYAGGGR